MDIKKLIKLLVLCGLGLCVNFSALAEPQHHVGFKGGASLDFSEPSNDGLEFARVNGTTFNVKPDYDVGFSLYAGYDLSEQNFIDLFYSYFHGKASSSESAESLLLQPSGNVVGNATGEYKLKSQELSIGAGHYLIMTPSFEFKVAGGLMYGGIQRNFITSGTTPGTVINEMVSKFHGFGPYFGGEGICYPFQPRLRGFEFYGSVNGGLLYGERVRSRNSTGAADGAFDPAADCVTVPYLRADVGIGYKSPDSPYEVRFGFSFEEYVNAIRDADNAAGSNVRSMSGVGPYLRVNYDF